MIEIGIEDLFISFRWWVNNEEYILLKRFLYMHAQPIDGLFELQTSLEHIDGR